MEIAVVSLLALIVLYIMACVFLYRDHEDIS